LVHLESGLKVFERREEELKAGAIVWKNVSESEGKFPFETLWVGTKKDDERPLRTLHTGVFLSSGEKGKC